MTNMLAVIEISSNEARTNLRIRVRTGMRWHITIPEKHINRDGRTNVTMKAAEANNLL